MKILKIICLLILIFFAGITGILSEDAIDGAQVVGGEAEPLPECSKTTDNREDDGTDNIGSYEYNINQDGTAEILKCLKEGQNVRIPSTLDGYPVTVIGEEAFVGKHFMKNVEIPGTVTEIKADAFSGTGIEEIILPEGVLKIGERAFWHCRELKRIYISKNVNRIEGNIVKGSGKLAQIDVDIQNTAYTSVDGILYNKDVTELLAVPGSKDLSGFRFIDSVVSIGEDAFAECANFTEVTIPDRVKDLGWGAFSYCSYLKKAIIGKNITEIPGAAFFGSGVTEVVIRGKLTKIGLRAFSDSALARIDIPDGVTEIGDAAFYNCGLESITVPKSVTKIGRRAIGYSEDCEELIPGVHIIGYKGTAAYCYAKEHTIIFCDAGTGKNIRFDLVSVPIPRERITVLTGGRKKIDLEYYPEEDVSYQIAVKRMGAPSWKKYIKSKTWAAIKGLKPGKQYKVKVRAWREIDGKLYYGKWSKVKKVKVR